MTFQFQRAAKRCMAQRLARRGATAAILGGALWAVPAWAAPASTPVYPTGLTNIASAASGGRVLDATSTMSNSPDFKASNLIDGQAYNSANKTGTAGWASNKFDPVNMDSVTLAFADNALKRIGKIVLNPASAVTPERWAKDVEVQVSTEAADGPYRPIAQLTLRRSPERQEFLVLPASARFVRLRFRSNWGSDQAVALGEVEIYEAVDQTDPTGQLIARLESAINALKTYQETQATLGDATGARTVSTRDSTAKAAFKNAKQSGKAAPSGKIVKVSTNSDVDAALSLLPNAPSNAKSRVANRPAPRPMATPAKSNGLRLVQDNGNASATTTATATATTPAASGAPRVAAGNIAASANGGKIMDVSSIFSNDPLFGPQTLIDSQNYSFRDDKGSYGWASEGFAPGQQFVTIGFRDDRAHLIGKIVLNPVSNQASLRWASRVDVQVTNGSAKSGPWRTVSTLNIRQEAANQDFAIRPVEAKYVRFVFTANGPGNPLTNADPNVSSDRAVSLGEIEIYEPNTGSGDLEAIVGRLTNVLNDLKRIHEQNKATATTAAAS